MNDPSFAVGDIVRLLSGGPDLTVALVSGQYANVVWFDAAGAYHQASVMAVLLKPESTYPAIMELKSSLATTPHLDR